MQWSFFIWQLLQGAFVWPKSINIHIAVVTILTIVKRQLSLFLVHKIEIDWFQNKF